MNREKYNSSQLTLAESLLDNGRLQDALTVLEPVIDDGYLPAYRTYLWAIWGDGNYYRRFTEVLEDGIARGSDDCLYIRLWKDFANRPAVDEYWTYIDALALKGQPESVLALALRQFLTGDRDSAVETLGRLRDGRRPLAFEENLSYMMRNCTARQRARLTELFGTVRLTDNVRFLDYTHHFKEYLTYSNDVSNYVDWEMSATGMLVNAHLSNEEFNATVFSQKRLLERRRIGNGEALSFVDIKDALVKSLPPDVRVMEGLTKDSWKYDDAEKRQKAECHSVYVMKRLDDGRWMTLRIGDHTSNLGDYYKYRRMYVPSSRPFANMCIMLHGDHEQLGGMKYSFRFNAATADPCVTVRDEDFQVYRPFMYTLVHYIPGLIIDVDALCREVNGWLDGCGLVPFYNPYADGSDAQGDDYDVANPTARISAGLAKIETWDIKYARRRREAMKKRPAETVEPDDDTVAGMTKNISEKDLTDYGKQLSSDNDEQ